MRTFLSSWSFVAIAAMFALLFPDSLPAQSQEGTPMMKPTIAIPQSIAAEHEAIHSALVEATQAPGRVGAAAKTLAEVLHPHFVREEQIALPPLGLLAPLAAGTTLSDDQVSDGLAMTASLRRELPRMLEEHKQIRAAVDGLRRAAREEQALKYERLADQLALHAQTEEEVLYPAAVLVGELIRAQRPGQ
jgi:iron-sulfur cluster repair protein YtfE (RIC family)